MRRLLALLASVAVVGLVACTPEAERSGSAPTTSTGTAGRPPGPSPAATSPTTARPSSTPAPEPSVKPSAEPTTKPTAKPNPISMAALIQQRYDGGRLRVGALQDDAGPYKRYLATFRSEGLRISGMIFVPDGRGPFPAVVTAHGYIPPYRYFPGQGMPREEDRLAREGYVVLHVDYRNHATSQNDGDGQDGPDYRLRLPYSVDVINAGLALRRTEEVAVDGDRLGILGRSMGGEVTLRAITAAPTVFRAAVVYASTSSLAADNWRRWYRGDPDRAGTNARIERTYGLPKDAPEFWRNASARPFFDRVQIPVQMHHGSADEECPYPWATATRDALRKTGADVTLFTYAGEKHTFQPQWQRSIRRTTAFFDRELASR